jgi:hypothetical protein
LILVVTPYEEEAKIKMGAPKERLILFPGGVDDVSFSQFSSSDPSKFLKELDIKPDSKVVAFVGTVEDRKNPSAIVEVAERLAERDDICFVIAGRGDSEYSETVKKKADGLPNVKYLGEISEKEKVQLIQNSFLNIILSKMEALGLAQLEFMFEGVPVITSGVGGQSWIVKDGEEGIHTKGPDDIEGATKAIAALTDDKAKWKKLSANAKRKASKYTLTKLMQTLDQAITNEMEKQTGLSTLAAEVRSTISQPEYVVHTWSHGTVKVAATELRIFIQRGRLSRNTLEIPYSSINSIEYVRQRHWKALLTGGLLSLLVFIQHYVTPIISRTLTSRLTAVASGLIPIGGIHIEVVIRFLWLFPISIGVIVFLIGMRQGYALHGATIKPVFLPPSFTSAVQYVREKQNQGNVSNSTDMAEPNEQPEEEGAA